VGQIGADADQDHGWAPSKKILPPHGTMPTLKRRSRADLSATTGAFPGGGHALAHGRRFSAGNDDLRDGGFPFQKY